MTLSVRVRYFAAAADASGVDEERVDLPDPSTIQDLRVRLGEKHGAELTRVLELCSFLAGGRAADPGDKLDPGPDGNLQVDVLPPFAGG